MSLVAYGNSDDSDYTDTEDTNGAQEHEHGPGHEHTGSSNTASALLSALPLPKQRHISTEFEEDEVEEAFKKKKDIDGLNISSKQPKAREPVKITVPLLINSPDEEDAPKKKKPKRAAGKVGLFALLPEPKNVTTKEAGRSLVPHTLTKTDKSKVDDKTKKPVKKDDFFSIGDQSDKVTSFSHISSIGQSVTGQFKLPNIQAKMLTSPSTMLENSAENDAITFKSKPADTSDNSIQDAPLDFKAAHAVSSTPYSTAQNVMSSVSDSQSYYDQPYQGDQGSINITEQFGDQMVQNDEQFMQDERFLRLIGKKQRGREEINIVDVHADDAIGEIKIEMTKGLSKEKAVRSSSKKGADGPSGQQKRKHQITYLAHQAKERELELKNQWAENRANKKAAQNKYGF